MPSSFVSRVLTASIGRAKSDPTLMPVRARGPGRALALLTFVLAMSRCLVAPDRAVASPCVPLGCDTPTSGTIDPADETDCYLVTAVDGERVNIEALTTATTSGAFGVCWGLYDKDGQPVAGCGACNGGDQCGPLSAAASPYSVLVADLNSDGTGTYQITLHPVNVP